MEKTAIIRRLLAIFTLILTGILAVGEKIIAAFSAVGKSIATGFAAIVAVILLMVNFCKSLMMLLCFALFFSAAQADWKVNKYTDEMSDEVSATATSPYVRGPYALFSSGRLQSSISFSCRKTGESVSIGFLFGDLFLTRGKPDFDSFTHSLRVRWDDDKHRVIKFRKYLDSNAVFFELPQPAIWKIRQHGKVRIEFNFRSRGLQILEYDLNGSTKAIDEARTICANARNNNAE